MRNPTFSKKLIEKWDEVVASLPPLEELLKEEQRILNEKYLNKPVKIKNKGWNKGTIRSISIHSNISLSCGNYKCHNRLSFCFEIAQHPDQRHSVVRMTDMDSIEVLEGEDLLTYEKYVETVRKNKEFHERINRRY